MSILNLNYPEENQGFLMSLVLIQFILIAFLLIISIIRLPYGRYYDTNLQLRGGVTWFIMESPSLIIPLYLIYNFKDESTFLTFFSSKTFYLIPFLIHYCHRCLIYPLHMQSNSMPLFTAMLGITYTTFNGYLQPKYILSLSNSPMSSLSMLRYIVGITVFFIGMFINLQADYYLIKLSKNKKFKGQYFIPRGYMFEYISCPNFFGETLEFFGYAICIWTLCGWGFFLQTFFTIIPRGYHHHQYYKDKFADYPPTRKAVIPFIL